MCHTWQHNTSMYCFLLYYFFSTSRITLDTIKSIIDQLIGSSWCFQWRFTWFKYLLPHYNYQRFQCLIPIHLKQSLRHFIIIFKCIIYDLRDIWIITIFRIQQLAPLGLVSLRHLSPQEIQDLDALRPPFAFDSLTILV